MPNTIKRDNWWYRMAYGPLKEEERPRMFSLCELVRKALGRLFGIMILVAVAIGLAVGLSYIVVEAVVAAWHRLAETPHQDWVTLGEIFLAAAIVIILFALGWCVCFLARKGVRHSVAYATEHWQPLVAYLKSVKEGICPIYEVV